MGEYIDAGGVRTYCEVTGEGDAVVLIHGGATTGESWAAQVPALAARYQVFVPDRRGHGRSPDVDGPATMDGYAADLVEFMTALRLDSAHVIGWSDGGKVAVRMALSRPDLVRKLVMIGTELTRAGGTPANDRLMTTPEGLEQLSAIARSDYERLSPDGPEHFGVVFAKWTRMWTSIPDIEPSELAHLPMPVLLMQGDDDCVRIEHNTAVARAIPDAQLAVIPGGSHAVPLEKPDLVNDLLLDFLTDPQTPKFMPLGDLNS
ncbi:alpha/beta fold hydrolase [Kribbella sp. NPDC049174]|uniref:alpha/beta fold hydrolase n=1 Tax=Kribbella sp. NPDC049174 TaxID=3364112 RepID=UPI0037228136